MLMDGDSVQYVGQSSNIEYRVACHLQAGKIDFGWVAYAEAKRQDMDLLEKQLIEKHNPPHNYTHTEKAHAERGPRVSLWKKLGASLPS